MINYDLSPDEKKDIVKRMYLDVFFFARLY